MDKRPSLNKNISVKDFQDFYWLKAELVNFCSAENLPKQGSKLELAKRIEYYLQTGEIPKIKVKAKKKTSNFDWNTAVLSLDTIITDNYKNTVNVRDFFATHLGKSFKFNVIFMNWMKANTGKTLADAIQEWKNIKLTKKHTKEPKNIEPQFEYNRYIRDFLKDNPDKNRATAIRYWKIKKSKRGDNIYNKTDLKS